MLKGNEYTYYQVKTVKITFLSLEDTEYRIEIFQEHPR